jgi:ComF family protein
MRFNKTGRAFFFLREYLFPSGCALCDSALISTEETWYGLCENCRARIGEVSASNRCDRCGKPLISERVRCLSCRNGPEAAFDRVAALFPYAGSYRRLLAAYKFGKNLALGNFFAERIETGLEQLRETSPDGSPEPVIVPVPPRPGKIKQSGWDQVEYLAALLEKGRGRAVSRGLKRLSSKVQKELNREDRGTNLRGRIVLKHGAPHTAILIDDVMTTGSTMDVCASVLKAGGAERVYGICLFHG